MAAEELSDDPIQGFGGRIIKRARMPTAALLALPLIAVALQYFLFLMKIGFGPILFEHGVRRIVDFGSGTLRNLQPLEEQFDEIALVETPTRCELLRPNIVGKNHIALFSTDDFKRDHAHYDAFFFICVLHTIPTSIERTNMIRIATEKLKRGGFIVVDVPQSETYYNRRRKTLPRYKDGYLLRWGDHFTFYKSFYAAELDALFAKIDALALFRKVWYTKHLIRIWRKTS
jgi:hypothetical protein